MADELKAAIKEYLTEHLRVEVADDSHHYSSYPKNPTVKVRLMLEGEVLSEDETQLIHTHGAE